MPIQTRFAGVGPTLSRQPAAASEPPTLQHTTRAFANVVTLSASSDSKAEAPSQADKRAAGAAVALNSRGVKLKSEGNLDGAVASYREAIGFAPDCAAIWLNLGNGLLAQQRTQQAVEAFRRAAGLEPGDSRVRLSLVTALNSLGVELKAADQFEQAIQHYREALALAPDQAAIWSNLGNALTAIAQQTLARAPAAQPQQAGPRTASREMQLLDEAVQCHRRALSIEPDRAVFRDNLAIALNGLGVACRARGLARRAVTSHRESVALNPRQAWGWANLGNALKDMKHLESAVACHRRAIALDPDSPALVNNLGITLATANRSREAVACFDDVLARQPDDANARWDRGLSLLRMGELARGWDDYEARFQAGKLPPRYAPGERWQGAPYPGQRLLLLSEQGFGDAIWTARYLRQAKALGGELFLEARQELIPLLATLGVADRIIAKGARLPEADWHLHICSLPGLFSRSFADVSGQPYLIAPADRGRQAVAAINAVKDRLRIGIVWSGSASFKANHERRSPLGAFLSAFALPGVQLFSLQKGPAEAELQQIPAAPVIDLAPMLADFADTAAAVAALDLVIMTDSAVAHLAGALGTPVWVLANCGAYWLWLEDRADSPWYDSLRLFRAKTWNDWAGVFDAASAALMHVVDSAFPPSFGPALDRTQATLHVAAAEKSGVPASSVVARDREEPSAEGS